MRPGSSPNATSPCCRPSARPARIHSVPVGFTVEDGIITSDGTQKVRHVERSGQATVAQVDGRRWITFVGTAGINRDPDSLAHAVAVLSALPAALS